MFGREAEGMVKCLNSSVNIYISSTTLEFIHTFDKLEYLAVDAL